MAAVISAQIVEGAADGGCFEAGKALHEAGRITGVEAVDFGASGLVADGGTTRDVWVGIRHRFLDFTAVFTFAFIEPQMYFYLYGRLGFTAAEVGSLIGAFGLALVAAQAGLGQLSDRIGRRVPVVTGFVLLGVFYLALAGVHARVFAFLLFVAAVGGLGNGLFGPALSASYLDITREQHRSVIAGIKGSASSLGGVAGPFLVAVLSPALGARGVFASSAALAVLAAVRALVALRFARRATVAQDELISERAPVVAAGLRGIAAAAAAARGDARRTVT